jgi:hypothetical protein
MSSSLPFDFATSTQSGHEPFNLKIYSMTGRDVNFTVDEGQVGIDGASADYQFPGNLGIGESLRDQAQHVHLARRESIRVL